MRSRTNACRRTGSPLSSAARARTSGSAASASIVGARNGVNESSGAMRTGCARRSRSVPSRAWTLAPVSVPLRTSRRMRACAPGSTRPSDQVNRSPATSGAGCARTSCAPGVNASVTTTSTAASVETLTTTRSNSMVPVSSGLAARGEGQTSTGPATADMGMATRTATVRSLEINNVESGANEVVSASTQGTSWARARISRLGP